MENGKSNGKITNKIIRLIKSRYPIISVSSHEEERVLSELLRVHIKDKKFLFTWDSDRGLSVLNNYQSSHSIIYNSVDEFLVQKWRTNEKYRFFLDDSLFTEGDFGEVNNPPYKTFNELIAFMSSFGRASTFILLDSHEFISKGQPENIRKVKNLSLLFGSSGKQSSHKKSIVFLSPVVVIPPELDKLITVVDFLLPDRGILRQELDRIIALFHKTEAFKPFWENLRLTEKEKFKVIQAGLGLTVTEFEQGVNFSFQNNYHVEGNPIQASVIQEFKEGLVKKSGLLEYIKPVPKDSVGGLGRIKEAMDNNLYALSPEASKAGACLDKGILLVGLSGTGKSLIVKAAGDMINLPVLKLDMGNIFAGIVGESESNVKNALNLAATNAPCILWIDEIEKALAGVESSGKTDSGVTARVFGMLLTFMEECSDDILFFATCNEIRGLHDALKRRFQRKFFVDLPAFEARSEILKIHLTKKRRPDQEERDMSKFDIPRLARLTLGYTGAEIETVVLNATITGCKVKGYFDTSDMVREIKGIIPMSISSRDEIIRIRKEFRGKVQWADKETVESENYPDEGSPVGGTETGIEL